MTRKHFFNFFSIKVIHVIPFISAEWFLVISVLLSWTRTRFAEISLCPKLGTLSEVRYNDGNNKKEPRFISRSKIGEKSIQYKGNQIWNAMEPDIKNSESLSVFKSAYKKFLLESEIDPNLFLNPTNLLLCSWVVHPTMLLVMCKLWVFFPFP